MFASQGSLEMLEHDVCQLGRFKGTSAQCLPIGAAWRCSSMIFASWDYLMVNKSWISLRFSDSKRLKKPVGSSSDCLRVIEQGICQLRKLGDARADCLLVGTV